MNYHVHYRGPLTSCNYACGYCPFAKRKEDRAALLRDRAALARFLAWVEVNASCRFGILFTPWGEALVRPWYRDALTTLSHWRHVTRAVIQTNLSCPVDWIARCNRSKLALWTTFHPREVALEHFVAKVRRLHEDGVRLSVGIVGLREHFEALAKLRQALPADV